MGRGRQKAKHMKVARKLKYFSPDTDFDSLERELAGNKQSEPADNDTDSEDKYYDDETPAAGWGYSAWDQRDD